MSEFDYSWHNLAKIFLIHDDYKNGNNVVLVVVAMDDIHCQEYTIVAVHLCYLLITFSISSLFPFLRVYAMLRMSLLI